MRYRRNTLRFTTKLLFLLGTIAFPYFSEAQAKPEGILVDRIIAKVDNYIVLNHALFLTLMRSFSHYSTLKFWR